MIRNNVLCLLLLAAAAPSFASPPSPPAAPTMEISVHADRVSQYPMSAEQTRRLDEATKVSAALRLYYGLYQRWPKDIDELRIRTSNIDYAVLGDSLKMERDGAGLEIVFSDGSDDRSLRVDPQDPLDKAVRDIGQQPGFTISVKLSKTEAVAEPDAPQRSGYDDPDSPEWATLKREAYGAMAKVLVGFPDVKEGYLLTDFPANGPSRFGVDLVCDGAPNEKAYDAAAAAFATVAPKHKILQLVDLPPEELADIVMQEKLEPFYRRP